MNERSTNDLETLYKNMGTYNFNKSYNLTVSIVESDHAVDHSEMHVDSAANGDTRPRPIEINVNDPVASVHQNTHTNNKNESDNTNNAQILTLLSDCNVNEASQNISPTNANSWITDLLSPQCGIINSQPTDVHGDLPSNNRNSNRQLNEFYKDLLKLSQNIINILIAYNFLLNSFTNNDKLNIRERYIYIKEYYIRASHDIVVRSILPQGNKFNVIVFLEKTVQLAKNKQKFHCSYKNVETIYNEIMCSYYKKGNSHEIVPVSHMYTNTTQTSQSLQKDLHSERRFFNMTQTINSGNNSILQQNSQNFWHSNVITETTNNGLDSSLTVNVQNDRNYINIPETINGRSNSIVQRNSEIERDSSNIAQPINIPNSAYQGTQNNGYYNNETRITNAASKLRPSYKNSQQLANSMHNNVLQSLNKNSIIQQNVENNRSYKKQQQKSSDQRLMEVPTTCIFQYKSPSYEVRLDVNNHVLNDIHKPHPDNTYVQTKTQHTSHDVRNSAQSLEPSNEYINRISHHGAPQILQQPTRSTSRDSGFTSPSNNQSIDLCNSEEGQASLSPYISLVTSLNPDAVRIPAGTCHVCGVFTRTKCVGCLKYYYCSYQCQNEHWRNHKFDCNQGTQQIR